jgi:N-acyl-D-aspartate/D-glutamate deacylase
MGPAAVERAATAEERARMVALVRDGMGAGAIGWSTSLSPTHFFGDGTPAPSRLAEPDELLALAAGLRDLERGVIEIAPRTAIGSAEDKAEEQRFFAELARASGKVVSWAPLLDSPFAPGSAQRLIAEAAELQAQGLAVVPQVGCRPLEVRFDFAEPAFFLQQVPHWRAFMAKPRAERRRLFGDPDFRRELAGYGDYVAGLAQGWDRIVLRMPASAGTRAWQDRSVAEIAAARGRPALDTFCDVVLADDLAGQWGIVMMNGDEARVAELIRHPAGLLALSDAGAHVDTLCDQGFTTYLLGHWVRERGALSLEEAVRLVTSVPAERYGLRGRGRLAPGSAADLVVFDPARVATRRTEMVRDLPRGERRLLQGADGIVHVFVNGTAVVERGEPVDRRPGRVLRGGA